MSEQPGARPVTPRTDEASADLGSLVDMGVVPEQPEPSPEPPPPSTSPFLEPVIEPPPEPPVE